MKKNSIQLLKTEILKTISVLDKMECIYKDIELKSNDQSDIRNAVILAEVFVNYYTCLETVFFRISTFFENNLNKEKWHSELLRKMNLNIDGIRKNAISDDSYRILDEFRCFRHFKRYYYDFTYDWDKLNFLKIKFDTLCTLVKNDLNEFILFLDRLDLDQ